MFERKALTYAAFCTFAAIPAQAQNIPHQAVANVCFQNGQCLELPADLVFLSADECQAALPQLYAILVQYLMQQGLASYILTADVACEPVGSDA